MKVRALRGVCIGVERHLAPGAEADLPAADVQFLEGIGAVERVANDAPAAAAADPQPTAPALKAGKKE